MPTRPTGTVAVNETDLSYGDQVTFTVTASQFPAYVLLHAYQGEQVVAVGYSNFLNADGVTRPMGLSSSIWPSGAAHCTADLVLVERKKRRILASIEFEVSA